MPTHHVDIYTSFPKPKDYPKDIQNLADAIKAKRLDSGLTKVELGKLLQVSPLTIGTWENSNKKPVPRMMKKIINWLGYIPPLGIDENSLGGQLYVYRCKYGLTQKGIATKLQIDRWAVTKIEQNIDVNPYYEDKIYQLLD